MEIEDFKEITEGHVETCKKIIEQKGACVGIGCKECPFTALNNARNKKHCGYSYVASGQTSESRSTVVEYAEKFLDLCSKKEYLTKDEMIHEMVVNKRTLVDIHGNKAWYDPNKKRPFRFQIRGSDAGEALNSGWGYDWRVYNPYEDWEIDDKILVWGSADSRGKKRHFAGVHRSGRPLAWDDGKTSHTSDCKVVWKHAELYIDED